MSSLFTFALGAVSALILVPVLIGGKHRHRHHHGGIAKPVGRSGGKRGK